MIDIAEVLAASFPIMWEAEGRPTLDFLGYRVVNQPVDMGNPTNIEPYHVLQDCVPCVFAGGPIEGAQDDDTTKVDYTFFVEVESLTFKPNQKTLIRYRGRMYKLKDGGINDIFNLLEFTVIRGD